MNGLDMEATVALISSTEENPRAYRELLVAAQTIRQRTGTGIPMREQK